MSISSSQSVTMVTFNSNSPISKYYNFNELVKEKKPNPLVSPKRNTISV